MAYAAISRNAIDEEIRKYEKLKTKLDQAKVVPNDKQDQEISQRLRASLAQRGLAAGMKTAATYLKTHAQKTDKWHTTATALLKASKTLAARYKKVPTLPEAVLDLKDLVSRVGHLKKLEADYARDSREFSAAWAAFREFDPPAVLPAEYTKDFRTARTQLQSDHQEVMVKGNAISAMYQEAQALKAITDKAYMKSRMKAGTGSQRPLSAAQAAAAKVAAEMAEALREFNKPSNRTPAPGAVTDLAQDLKEFHKNPAFATSRENMIKARNAWTQADLAYKTMVSKSASMEKVLATQTKGFRSNELTDPKVKAELAEAARDVKAAKAEVKEQAPAHAVAKKLWTELDAKFKKAGIR
jgi:hypothetical protein